jgi:hypothetical protein
MSDEAVPDAKPKLSLFALIAFAAVVIGVALLLVSTNNTNAAPFTATEVHPRLVGLAVQSRGGVPYVVGRVDVDDRAAPGVTYEVIVVDDRRHRVVPCIGTVTGWDGATASLRKRYDWQPSDLDRAALFPAGSASSFRFSARLPTDAPPVTNVDSDLTVVLALTHGSDHVYWAVKLR